MTFGWICWEYKKHVGYNLTFLGHPPTLLNYRLQSPVLHTKMMEQKVKSQKKKEKKKKPTRILVSLVPGKFRRGKISFQRYLAETEGVSLRRRQRLTVNSDVRTHGVWRWMCAGVWESEWESRDEGEWGRERRGRVEGGGGKRRERERKSRGGK